MLAFLFGKGVLDGHVEIDVEPTPMHFEAQDPDEHYGTKLDWGYGQSEKDVNEEGLVRVRWHSEDGPDWVDPRTLTPSIDLCIYGTRENYLSMGGKKWAADHFWERKENGEVRWKWYGDQPFPSS